MVLSPLPQNPSGCCKKLWAAVGFALLAVVLWFWYPLHKKKVEMNVEILREKHAKGIEG